MTALTRPADRTASPPAPDSAAEGRRAARDSLVVTLGGQVERILGILTVLALRWGLDPARLGVYTGLRIFLDNTNRSSLGLGLGAVQEIPILRAQGREAEAARVANVAHAANTLTCLAYAAGLVGWACWRASSRAGDPLAAEWTWGLVAVAGLAILKRYESFLIAVLRAHEEFALTTRLDILESLVSACAVGLGLWLADFWGLLAAVAVILGSKIAYMHASHPLRFRWEWDWPLAWRLMHTGLPILANTAAFGCVLGIDRALILGIVPDGERAVGLYSMAILGTSWSLDLAGRVVLVLYPYFQGTLGRTGDVSEVARRAARATEVQAPILAAGGAAAYVLAPAVLGALIPRYAEGLPAIRPLLPGAVMLAMAWPARQMMIAVGRPYRLFATTLLGLAAVTSAGAIGAKSAGIIGVAWGMTAGYLAVYALTSASAFASTLGPLGWIGHQARIGATFSGFVAAALVASHVPLGGLDGTLSLPIRGAILAGLTLPPLFLWARRNGYLGLEGKSDVEGE